MGMCRYTGYIVFNTQNDWKLNMVRSAPVPAHILSKITPSWNHRLFLFDTVLINPNKIGYPGVRENDVHGKLMSVNGRLARRVDGALCTRRE